MIMDKVKEGKLIALIARCAFFYGPGIKSTSKITELIFKPFSEGEKAKLLGSDKCKMSVTYTPDAGKATALLGNTDNAYNQVWHLPTAANPLTGKEWVEAIAKEMGVKPRYLVLPKFLLRILGLFQPIMAELVEGILFHKICALSVF